jgi:hypothetical protein
VDFVVGAGGLLELFEAKCPELSDASDAVKLGFVTKTVGSGSVAASSIICRAPTRYTLANEARVVPIAGLG